MINNDLYSNDTASTANLCLPWDRLANKSVLVTGAAGLIGSCLVDVLMYRNKMFNDCIKICALGRSTSRAKEKFLQYWDDKNFEFIEHDINQPLMSDSKVDFILHGASNAHPILYSNDPIGTITTNVFGTYNLLNYAIAHGIQRLLLMSSVEIYGENRGDAGSFSEDYCGHIDCNTLRAGYPESKRLSESLCQAFISKYGVDVTIARLSRTYGGTMSLGDSKAIAQFILSAVNGKDIVLKSEGKQVYSYSYVFDSVSAILSVLLLGKNGEAYNVSDDKSTISIADLAKFIAEYAGVKVVFEMPSEAEKRGYSVVSRAVLDSSKLRALGWKSQNDIYCGIKKTIEILKGKI